MSQWRSLVVPNFEVPPDTQISIICDPAFSAVEREAGRTPSDRSAFVSGFIRILDDGISDEFVLLKAWTRRWKGGQLAQAALEFCSQWPNATLEIERIPGSELLRDSILWKAELDGVAAPRIRLFNPVCMKGAKNVRIKRLRGFVECEMPALRIVNGDYVGDLLEEVEKFVPEQGQRGRQVNLLDALALACFGSLRGNYVD